MVGEVGRTEIEGYVSWLLGRVADSTANQEYRSLQQFFRWLFEEGDISVNPFDRMCPPMIEQRQCRTSPETGFEDRRDKALFTMLVDTDARLCEIAGLGVDDIDWDLGVAVVVGKGKGQRTLPMSPTTIKELDRCVFKARRSHRHADSVWLWRGRRGRMSSSGIARTLKRRCAQAGIGQLHVHQFREVAETLVREGFDPDQIWLSRTGRKGDLRLQRNFVGASLQEIRRSRCSVSICHRRRSRGGHRSVCKRGTSADDRA